MKLEKKKQEKQVSEKLNHGGAALVYHRNPASTMSTHIFGHYSADV